MKLIDILFKAKLKNWKTNSQQNKWVEGFYLNRKETTYCFKEDYERFPVKTLHFIAVESMTDWGLPNKFDIYEIDPDTLCMFTGQMDINNTKIWENDYVKVSDDIYMITWQKDDAMFALEDFSIIESFKNIDCKWCEVIGNTFDTKL